MKTNPCIGIFDSGIGGLSILDEVRKMYPYLEIHYISDDAFAPYGTKSQVELYERTAMITQQLIDRGCDVIFVACNTATTCCIKNLRQLFSIPFIGTEPYIKYLHHCDLPANKTKMAVITTMVTGQSQRFKELKQQLDPQNRLLHFSLKNLATLIEELFYQGQNDTTLSLIQKEIAPLKNMGLTHLILGCTHYPFIQSYLEKELSVQCISPCHQVARRLSDVASLVPGPVIHTFYFLSTTVMNWDLMSSIPKELIR